jgi:hypothetical protein
MVSRWKMATIVIAAGLIIALASLWEIVPAYQTSVDYWMEQKDGFKNGLEWLSIHCKNDGGTNVGFNLVLTLENGTFSIQAGPQYFQVVSIMKFRFALAKEESVQKTVYFLTNETGEFFRLRLSLEKINFWDMLKGNGLYPTTLSYRWDEQQGSFVRIPQIQHSYS